jgi:hypothetical protein
MSRSTANAGGEKKMTLEEALRVRGDRDLPSIRAAFKEAGMPAQVRDVATILDEMIFVMGTIGCIKSLLKERLAQLEEEDEDTGSLQTTNLEIVEKVAGIIAGIMERYKPGDPLPGTGFAGMSWETGRQTPWKDEMQWFIAISTLKGNGLAREEDGRVILRKRADPESLVMALPEDIIEGIDPEILKDRGITANMTVSSVPEYRLVFEPEAILEADLENIDDLAVRLDLDPDTYAAFREAVFLKQLVAARVQEIIEERGTLTPEEVAEILKKSVVEDPDGIWTISLNLSTEFVKGVLEDLRKIGLLSKKGTGFRAV